MTRGDPRDGNHRAIGTSSLRQDQLYDDSAKASLVRLAFVTAYPTETPRGADDGSGVDSLRDESAERAGVLEREREAVIIDGFQDANRTQPERMALVGFEVALIPSFAAS